MNPVLISFLGAFVPTFLLAVFKFGFEHVKIINRSKELTKPAQKQRPDVRGFSWSALIDSISWAGISFTFGLLLTGKLLSTPATMTPAAREACLNLRFTCAGTVLLTQLVLYLVVIFMFRKMSAAQINLKHDPAMSAADKQKYENAASRVKLSMSVGIATICCVPLPMIAIVVKDYVF